MDNVFAEPRVEVYEYGGFSPSHSPFIYLETHVPTYLREELGEMNSLGHITKKVLLGYKGRIYMVEYEEVGVHIHTNACRLIIKELPESVNSTCIVQGYDRSVIPTAAKIIADRYLDDHPELLYK
jgi:hypothetical protein